MTLLELLYALAFVVPITGSVFMSSGSPWWFRVLAAVVAGVIGIANILLWRYSLAAWDKKTAGAPALGKRWGVVMGNLIFLGFCLSIILSAVVAFRIPKWLVDVSHAW